MRALLLAAALALPLAALCAVPAAACHPYPIHQAGTDPAIYWWVDQGCPHGVPTVCVVVVWSALPQPVPVCA
jgi:hypothetical protein